MAFDIYGVPYDYIDPETVKKTPNLRAKYDVIIFGPGRRPGRGRRDRRCGGIPIPWNKKELPNVGAWAQTDDTRIGMGLEGLITCASSSRRAACSSDRTARPSSRSATTSRTA